MDLRFALARRAASLLTWMLKHVFHRPAANFPGKAGLAIDRQLIAHLRTDIRKCVIAVVGTNGKTTVTNLLADAIEASGGALACNRTGANLDSGVATALLHARGASWAVLECDELWLAGIAGQLKPDYVVLLNLFRDQLDRSGEIDHVQDSIARALRSCPAATLVYNADDPLCQAIADDVDNARIPFGMNGPLGLPQEGAIGMRMCRRCSAPLQYEWRQYGQLGNYRCPNCGFAREEPLCRASDVLLERNRTSLTVESPTQTGRVSISLPGAYTAYNVLAVCAAADCCDMPLEHVSRVARSYRARNGRLQTYSIGGREVLLNLAKNPAGMNQSLRIALASPGPKALAVFINDKEADGHDVSWLWDADFEQLARDEGLAAFAGGLRRGDVQVRMKYAGVNARLVDDARDFLSKAATAAHGAPVYIIANYTALPTVKAELDRLQDPPEGMADDAARSVDVGHSDAQAAPAPCSPCTSRESAEPPESARCTRPLRGGASRSAKGDGCTARALPTQPEHGAGSPADGSSHACEELTVVHLYPDLMNLYGDSGNVGILEKRMRWHGLKPEVRHVTHGQPLDLADADIVFLGGGPDREQRIASADLLRQARALRDFVEDDGVLLAICGGFQILGREWLLAGETVAGLGIVDMTTGRAPGGSHDRLVGNVFLESPTAETPVVGYENHAGRTTLGAGCEPFGRVIGKHGKGNNGLDGTDGVLYRNVVGTYLHGPLLSKNPQVADWLIGRALARRAARRGCPVPALAPLDDAIENAANRAVRSRM